MTHFDIFNGDADGICALLQLRLAAPIDAILVTGAKRDVALLDRVAGESGDSATVLDISLAVNRTALQRLLDRGVAIQYFDHHYAGEIPVHPGLEAHIDPDPSVCTGILVDRHLGGRHRIWAVVAAFGDNLTAAARDLASSLALTAQQVAAAARSRRLPDVQRLRCRRRRRDRPSRRAVPHAAAPCRPVPVHGDGRRLRRHRRRAAPRPRPRAADASRARTAPCPRVRAAGRGVGAARARHLQQRVGQRRTGARPRPADRRCRCRLCRQRPRAARECKRAPMRCAGASPAAAGEPPPPGSTIFRRSVSTSSCGRWATPSADRSSRRPAESLLPAARARPEFGKLFKVAVDFEGDMERDRGAEWLFAQLIGAMARANGLRPFDRAAVARVIEHASRVCGSAERLSVEMSRCSKCCRRRATGPASTSTRWRRPTTSSAHWTRRLQRDRPPARCACARK